ncbi:MAG: NADH-quinone oxidoreductase subunit N [Actinobacteria bacterium]|nr:NADH-quinone oxidoreductase subunit N [Actinomycetota bacterium]
MNVDLISIIPEMVITATGLLVLLLSVFIGKKFDRAIAPISAAGIIAAIAAVFIFNFYNRAYSFSNSFVVDNFSNFFRIFTLVSTLIFTGLSASYIKDSIHIKRHLGEFYFLVLTVCTGTMLMSASGDLIMLFISLELVSIPTYILAGYEKANERSNEAALKYFILGILASAILAYGFSMIYGATGEVNLKEIARVIINRELLNQNFMLVVGIIMSLIGFGFKIGSAPFHWWAPDTYEGAPTIVTTLITTIAKIAAFAGLIRFLYIGISRFSKSLWIIVFIIILSLMSVIIGNFMALPQKNFKRLMAYSSISHAGFMLVGFAVATVDAQWAVFLYLMAYISMNLGAFAVAMLVERTRKSEEIAAFAGIGYTNPFISICMIIFMISMVGLPPFAGFIGKLFVFKAGVENNLTWLVIVGVLTSVVSLWYYVNIIRHMYFVKYEGAPSTARIETPKLSIFIITILALFTLAMVIVPSVFIMVSTNSVTSF